MNLLPSLRPFAACAPSAVNRRRPAKGTKQKRAGSFSQAQEDKGTQGDERASQTGQMPQPVSTMSTSILLTTSLRAAEWMPSATMTRSNSVSWIGQAMPRRPQQVIVSACAMEGGSCQLPDIQVIQVSLRFRRDVDASFRLETDRNVISLSYHLQSAKGRVRMEAALRESIGAYSFR